MENYSVAVIDAGVVIASVIATPDSEMAMHVIRELHDARVDFYAPSLLFYEL